MKIKKSIFTKLIGSFVLYAAAVCITFVLCMLLEMMLIGNGDITSLQPSRIIDEHGSVVNLEIAQKMGGWVEELDADYTVVNIYGEKMTTEKSYTPDDILKLTSAYGNTEYVGFFMQPEYSDSRFLCLYDRDIMRIDTTIILNDIEKFGTPNLSFLFFPLAVIEMLLTCLYLKKKIKRPLVSIVEGMEQLKSGDDGARISIKTEAEFEQIVDTFNVMAQQLATERAEKEQLTQKKNQMLLELSHDIKTPVATIKSYARALADGLVPEERITDTYQIIDAKANRVQRLTEDMFTMLKMDNPDYRLNLETVNLCECLRQLCAEYYDEVTQSGFDFRIDIPEIAISAEVDSDLILRVMSNLISNAVKYNKTGRTIAVSIHAESDRTTLAVSDDGEEIDKVFAESMFNAFARGDKARKTDGGTGLGLAISAIIAEKHGGKITYCRRESENVFELHLPSQS